MCSLGEDLSELLRPRQQPACADDLLESVAVKNGKGPVFDKIKATHGEQRRWQRQDKFNRVVRSQCSVDVQLIKQHGDVPLACS